MTKISPTEYFDEVKRKRETLTYESLTEFYDNCLVLFHKYQTTGQTRAMEKLAFYIDNVPKERELLSMGFDRYVHQDDVTEFLENVSERVIKITDLASYERDIPNDIAANIEITRHIFDEYYVVFTDYTGEAERKVAVHRRDKDPILFGTFKDQRKRHISNRFYFLGDWVDEHCDLTFDRFISESKQLFGKDPTVTIQFPQDMDSIHDELDRIRMERDKYQTLPDEKVKERDEMSASITPVKKSLLERWKAIFSR